MDDLVRVTFLGGPNDGEIRDFTIDSLNTKRLYFPVMVPAQYEVPDSVEAVYSGMVVDVYEPRIYRRGQGGYVKLVYLGQERR